MIPVTEHFKLAVDDAVSFEPRLRLGCVSPVLDACRAQSLLVTASRGRSLPLSASTTLFPACLWIGEATCALELLAVVAWYDVRKRVLLVEQAQKNP